MTAVVFFGNSLPPDKFQDTSKRLATLLAGLSKLYGIGVRPTPEEINYSVCSCTIQADAATIERIRAELGPLGVEVSVVHEGAFKGAE